MRQKPLPRRRAQRRPVLARRSPLLALRRHPRLWWPVVLAVAAGIAWTVAGAVGRAEDAAGAWGDSAPVVVATRDLPAGAELSSSDVTIEVRPTLATPAGALREIPSGQMLRAAVYDGEAVLAERLAPAGLTGVAALLPDGTRAVAIPVEPGLAPPLREGDIVDVVVALSPESAGGGPPGFVLAPSALVVDVGDHAVAVAVERADAPRVAVALGHGAVSLALVGGEL